LREAIRLLRAQRRARFFFLAVTQSSVGTGAGYVALLLIAYERFRSPWAISLILLADFLPVMVLGPLLGAAADRWSRRWCVVIGDIVRAVAFIGIAWVDDFTSTVALALLAGAGTALFRPAALAGLSGLVGKEETASATSLFSATSQVGWSVGPAIAAAALLVASPESVAIANGVTFALSAIVLVRLPLDRPAPVDPVPAPTERLSLLREGLSGWRSVAALIDLRIVILASTAGMFFGGLFNVAEPLFAIQTLNSGESGYSVLVAIYGAGFIAGSLAGSSGGEAPVLRQRYIQGLAVTGLGSLCITASPSLVVALLPFALAGLGNGLTVVYERLLIQHRVPDELVGRAFALSDTLVSWALAIAFLSAGAIAAATGPRWLIGITAAGELILVAIVARVLRAKSAVSGRAQRAPIESSRNAGL
jgi:MFS family permease